MLAPEVPEEGVDIFDFFKVLHEQPWRNPALVSSGLGFKWPVELGIPTQRLNVAV